MLNLPTDETKLFFMVAHGIWLAYYKLCFEEKDTPIETICTKSMSILKGYKEVRSKGKEEQPRKHVPNTAVNRSWSPLEEKIYKINSDAAMLDNGNWGLGTMI